MQKCRSIIVSGEVQDISFRSIVEHIGRSFGLPGLIFNAKDGNVKILCSGEDSVIDNFIQTIRMRGMERGAEIESIKQQTLSIDIDLPDEFSRVSSDDEIDIGRKLDKANLLLKSGFENLNADLNTDFNNIKTGFENLNADLNTGLNDIKTGLNNLATMTSEHNARLEAHDTHLEAILEKLAEK